MKAYLQTIKYTQEILLGISILILMILPSFLVFQVDQISDTFIQKLYAFSHISLFFVMMIRPLADIFLQNKWIRPLVILRKGIGVFSASIIVSFILAKIIISPSEYFSNILTLKYWSMDNFALFAHLADISAILLLITSNNLSKKLLGSWWKKIQKLSYVYFYGSALYVYLSYNDTHLLYAMILVTVFTFWAYLKNRKRRLALGLPEKTI